MSKAAIHYSFDHEHLLGIDGLHPLDLTHIWRSARYYERVCKTVAYVVAYGTVARA